jgi:diguanylate cyclase (GGDEF)-like protein/PAS domain S-box-containing protein
MSWHFEPNTIPYLIVAAVAAFLSLLVLLRRKVASKKPSANRHVPQDNLANTKMQYQILFESTDEAIVLSTLQGEIVECNPATSKIFGYAKEELVGSPLYQIIDAQSVISSAEAITRFRRNGFSISEGIGRGKFASEFPIEIHTRPINFAGEQFIFTQVEDITSRRRVETALQESLGKARSFYKLSRSCLDVEHLPDLLQSITDGLSEALHADRVITVIFDQDQGKILHFIRGGACSDQIEFTSFEELKQGLTGWVVREKKPALSPKGRPDLRESPKVENRRRGAQSGAVLVAPIIREDQVVGTITAIRYLDQPNFTQQDSEFLMAIANQVAIAIQLTSRLEDAQRRLQAAETLRNTSTAVAATLQQDETIERVLEQLAMVVPYDSASVQMLGDGYLEIVGGRGWSDPKAVIGIRFPVPGDNPNTRIIQTRRTHLLGDAASSHSSFFNEPHSHINSWLGVPMIVDDQVIGMLTLDSTNKYFYGEHHAKQALAFADQVAIAVKNAHMYSSERRRVDELDALRATIADISAELELPRLLKAILERATLLLDASGGDLGLYDDENKCIVIAVSHNMGDDYAGTRMSIGEGAMGKVAGLIQPVVIDNYAAWPGKSPQYQSGPWNAVIAVPLLIGGHIIGAIGVVDSNPDRKFTPSDQRLLTLFGQQAAIAIQNARLFEAEQARAREAETLRRAGAAVAATLDQNQAIEKILEQLHRVVPYDSASVQLLHNGFLEVVGGRGWSDQDIVVGIRLPVPADNPNTRVIQDRQSVIVNDTSRRYPLFRQSGLSNHICSWLGTPLIIQEKVIGMLAVHKKDANFYSPNHARLITAFADHVAIAIENARLFAEVQTQAITDSLTGLYNRRGLFELGQRELDRLRRFERPLAAIMLDIDYFKQVNDTYSHAIGDQVLKELAARCRTHLREIDILGRYGGEEFAILLPETDQHDAYRVAERIRKHMIEASVQTDQGPVSITISLGVTAAGPDSTDLAVLLDRADTAMYSAKQSGRNQVSVN